MWKPNWVWQGGFYGTSNPGFGNGTLDCGRKNHTSPDASENTVSRCFTARRVFPGEHLRPHAPILPLATPIQAIPVRVDLVSGDLKRLHRKTRFAGTDRPNNWLTGCG